ncbi:CLUMA_CG005464, isoform A [Clunio marinus]|uniref:CLUMA_CG005464, isoform A n=1 Tax=Clunio marinus TaxID=568069 RepID=A0A1J1HWC2_9DIPT|nr:CLUMA_CG005464, isoform A [Clunio marinus]
MNHSSECFLCFLTLIQPNETFVTLAFEAFIYLFWDILYLHILQCTSLKKVTTNKTNKINQLNSTDNARNKSQGSFRVTTVFKLTRKQDITI